MWPFKSIRPSLSQSYHLDKIKSYQGPYITRIYNPVLDRIKSYQGNIIIQDYYIPTY